MALTTPKMVLKVWNLLTDPYDHDQLADNWAKIDQHDHTSNRGVQVPTEGIFDGAITSAKLATGLDPAPGYASYKVQHQRGCPVPSGGIANTTYLLSASQTIAALSGGSFAIAGYAFYIDPSDYAVASRSTVFRIRGGIITNTIAPAVSYTFALYTMTGLGGLTGVAPQGGTLSGAIAGTSAVVTTPAAGGFTTPIAGSDFTTAAGWYVLGVTISGAAAQPTQAWCDLQYRTV